MIFKLDIIKGRSFNIVKERLFAALTNYRDLLPVTKEAKILLKPNLNSNMNALTGNTTDLRLLSILIQFLKEKGYSNIVIGEGTNSGFYRNRIGVISRLGIDRMARHYGVSFTDLNYAESREISFKNGVKVKVAKECFEAGLFINLPKLKTHFEVGMSVCLKNLIGCLVGQENKKKTHDDLSENIIRLNQAVKPHLHIVDALIAMEGLGPTRGTPLRMDMLLIGTDPYLIDLACARLASFDHHQIKTLDIAEKKGLLTPEHHEFVASLDLENFQKKFAPPTAGLLSTFIHSPKRQKYFLKIRATRFFSYLASTNWFGELLFLTGLRQDVFLKEEMRIDRLTLDENKCDRCGVCGDVCPLGRFFPDDHKTPGYCLKCLYCFAACPKRAISYTGEAGFFAEQERQYDDKIRAMFEKDHDEA